MSSDDARSSAPEASSGRASSRSGRASGATSGTASSSSGLTRRQRRKARRRARPLWLRVILGMFWGFFTLFVLGVLAFVILYLRTDIPQPQQGAGSQLSILYYSDGKTELDRFSTVNRQDVQIGQIPEKVQYEFLSAEDRTFYQNRGISPTGIVRALWTNLKGGQEQGGSTITQQYVKNYFLTQDRTVTRKLKEAIIAIKIDQQYSKKQILQDYLNNIYFGRNSYGIQAASQSYFGKNVEQLNPSEGAFLAAVINAPGLYDPQYGANAKTNAQNRWNYVLDGMVTKGWMSQSERASLTFPTIKAPTPTKYSAGSTGYITASVRSELKSKLGLTDQDIDRGGLRITTTIDKSKQASAVSAVQKNVSADTERLFAVHTGLIAEQPNGAVVAMYGGRDYQKSQYSSATQATMQGGSSFKVFATVAALENGMSLRKTYSGASPITIGKTKFVNDMDEQFGTIGMTTALADSVNTYYVQLNQALGKGKTLGAAKTLGIPASDPGMNDPNTADVLGTASVRVIDMANSYNTVSTGGKKASPFFIQKVTSVVGDYTYNASPKQDQVVEQKVTADTTNAMSKVVTQGTAESTVGADFSRPAAGKTGTSSSFKSAWFTGYTPNQLTTSVGIYRGDGSASLSDINGQDFYGGTVPAQIWTDFMNAALKGEPVAKLPSPGNVNQGGTDTTFTPAPSQTQQTPSSTSQAPASSSAQSSATSSSQAPSSTSQSSSTAPSSSSQAPASSSAAPSTSQEPSSQTPASQSTESQTPASQSQGSGSAGGGSAAGGQSAAGAGPSPAGSASP